MSSAASNAISAISTRKPAGSKDDKKKITIGNLVKKIGGKENELKYVEEEENDNKSRKETGELNSETITEDKLLPNEVNI